VLVALLAIIAVACSSTGERKLSVDGVWGRTSPAVASNAAFYMVIAGGDESDTLMSADAAVCEATEIHASVMNDGVMSMEHLPDGIEIPAGEVVKLEPGGFHIMCIGKQDELVAGQDVPLTLEFAHAGTMAVDVEIRDE